MEALLRKGFLSWDDKKVIAKEFWDNAQEIADKRNKILKIIIQQLDKNDYFGTGIGKK